MQRAFFNFLYKIHGKHKKIQIETAFRQAMHISNNIKMLKKYDCEQENCSRRDPERFCNVTRNKLYLKSKFALIFLNSTISICVCLLSLAISI